MTPADAPSRPYPTLTLSDLCCAAHRDLAHELVRQIAAGLTQGGPHQPPAPPNKRPQGRGPPSRPAPRVRPGGADVIAGLAHDTAWNIGETFRCVKFLIATAVEDICSRPVAPDPAPPDSPTMYTRSRK